VLVRAVGLAMILVSVAILAGCGASASGASAVSYVTELDATHGLASGSPVTYGGDTIGSVTGIGWKLNGDSEINFEVQYDAALRVHQDSIMVLRTDSGSPTLDLYSPSPSSPVAAPGAKIDGASSQGELSAMLAARGFSSILGAAAALGSVPSAAGSTGTPPAAMTLDQLQKQLAILQAQAVANGAATTAASAAQLHSLNQQVQTLQQQVVRLGNSPQAQQLRDEIDKLAHTLTTAPIPPPSSSGTLVAPRVY
jgi:ABC-type transporter Mla subunit MlaD